MTDKADNDAMVRELERQSAWALEHCENAPYVPVPVATVQGILSALRTPQPEVDGADAQADAELVAAYPELAEHTDDPWFAVGFLREKFERSEAERAIWKERAMTMRIEPTRPQPDETETLRAEVARLREALGVADAAIKEMFRYYDGGETHGSYDGKPERNQLRKAGYATTAALKGTDHGRG